MARRDSEAPMRARVPTGASHCLSAVVRWIRCCGSGSVVPLGRRQVKPFGSAGVLWRRGRCRGAVGCFWGAGAGADAGPLIVGGRGGGGGVLLGLGVQGGAGGGRGGGVGG